MLARSIAGSTPQSRSGSALIAEPPRRTSSHSSAGVSAEGSTQPRPTMAIGADRTSARRRAARDGEHLDAEQLGDWLAGTARERQIAQQPVLRALALREIAAQRAGIAVAMDDEPCDSHRKTRSAAAAQ